MLFLYILNDRGWVLLIVFKSIFDENILFKFFTNWA